MKITLRPLSGRGLDIIVEYAENDIYICWGTVTFKIKKEVIEDIKINFFKHKDEWYSLGACVDSPIKNGLGEYIVKKHKLTPRHASVIAAIMYNEGLIEFRGKKPIELRSN